MAEVARGWSALRDGDWAGARAEFERALREGESPAAAEGLSWATWWLDDAAATFAARELAFRCYRAESDRAGAARMATWLACDELDFNGATAVAKGWLQRARRLLELVPAGPAHGWLAFFDGYVARVGGDPGRALELAREAAEVGRRFEVVDLEMLGLSLEGTILVTGAEVEDGFDRLDEATAAAIAGEAEIPISGAWTCCFMVGACAAVRDFPRASEWCDRIAAFADRYGSRYMLAFCRAEYGAIDLWRGHWERADSLLESSVADFARSRPAMVGGALVELAELRRRQGRTEEAEHLLKRAGSTSTALTVRARLALDAGEPGRASELVARALRGLPDSSRLDRVPALELGVRAAAAAGEPGEAQPALEELGTLSATARTEPLRAAVELAGGVLAAAAGDHERARPLLEDAADRYERCGGPFEAAEARAELAETLLALSRPEEAGREAAAAIQQLEALGAPATGLAFEVLAAARGADGGFGAVTAREREVLGLLAEGLTNRQIAERLMISEHTVHRHVTNLLAKLDAPSRAAAVAEAMRAGLLAEPPA
jgi:LuxR family transcriptional regulator, maltose regulon positive regulatory protein